MDKNGDAFQKRLLATFALEAEEHVHAISTGLTAIGQTGEAAQRQAIVEQVFRAAHSLKGAARAVGRVDVESLCQSLEGVFSRLKGGTLTLSPPLSALLHSAADTLAQLLANTGDAAPHALRGAVAAVRQRLEAAAASRVPDDTAGSAPSGPSADGGATPDASPAPAIAVVEDARQDPGPLAPTRWAADTSPAPPGTPGRAADTVRVAVTRLDTILFRAEALLAARLAAQQRARDLRELLTAFADMKRTRGHIASLCRSLRHDQAGTAPPAYAHKSGAAVTKLLDHLAREDTFARQHEIRLGAVAKAAELDGRALGAMADGLLDDVKQTLMQPVATATEALPRLVRDYAHRQHKDIEFSAACGDTEIDRRILEQLRDPLIHLVRNSLDHGIEAPEIRRAAGKPERGRIEVSARRIEGSRIEIVVADDGAGIDLDSLRRAAQRLGLGVAGTDAAVDPALLDLVFHSGLSTSDFVTDLSGHGLGLAIVREKVERLGGSVSVRSQPATGTRFRIVVPLTLATFHGVLVRVGDQTCIFPTTHVEQVARIARCDIGTVEQREVIELGGQTLALAHLTEVLESGIPPDASDERITVVVAASGGERIAFVVDEVIGEQEVLAKGLGPQLSRVRNVAAATVLGNGQVVPILYVPDLIKSARLLAARTTGGHRPVTAPAGKSVLVAEDSITSRQLLKGILEAAGYTVATAVDGLDAYTQLRTRTFDLLVSDVDMPHMNGFDLTARVRTEQALAQLPVVLVTTLDSDADRARGAEAGANAYLVKSRFDQDNLLAVIGRLL